MHDDASTSEQIDNIESTIDRFSRRHLISVTIRFGARGAHQYYHAVRNESASSSSISCAHIITSCGDKFFMLHELSCENFPTTTVNYFITRTCRSSECPYLLAKPMSVSVIPPPTAVACLRGSVLWWVEREAMCSKCRNRHAGTECSVQINEEGHLKAKSACK